MIKNETLPEKLKKKKLFSEAFLIENFTGIIVDSHAVVTNNIEYLLPSFSQWSHFAKLEYHS